MRYMIPLLAALALSACAGMTPAQIAGSTQAGLYAAATIARVGTVDEQLAPAYTRNALVRQRAARALETGRIDVGTARTVLGYTDAARRALDAARVAATPVQVAGHLATAQRATSAAESLLETAQ